MTAQLLEVDKVTLRYETERGTVTALESASFAVAKADRLVLLGPSGCGIQEALRIGNRILLLSPHPGRIKEEVASDGQDHMQPSGRRLSEDIHRSLFAESANSGSVLS